MKIKLDENLGNRGADILRASGHEVTTVAEEGLSSASDEDLVAICRAEHKCLVTLDLDFGNPMRFDPSHYHGIAVLRLPFKSTASDLFDVVRTLALELADTTIEGKLWIVQRGRIREYRQSPSSTEA